MYRAGIYIQGVRYLVLGIGPSGRTRCYFFKVYAEIALKLISKLTKQRSYNQFKYWCRQERASLRSGIFTGENMLLMEDKIVCGTSDEISEQFTGVNIVQENTKMTVEIWSDIACPFCYLGKKKFERSLENFENKDQIEVIWKSFQLNPGQKTDTTVSLTEYLAREKNWDPSMVEQTYERISESGRNYGINYDFNQAVPANTLRAHILLHLAKKEGKQSEVKESLFEAYFTNGKNVDDPAVLSEIAGRHGLNTTGFDTILESEELVNEVRHDIYEAQQLGISGVPFFVYNGKYGISGAQDDRLFTDTLKKSFGEWKSGNN